MERYSEYKDSGEQWLGEIPSHWECLPIRYIFSQRNECVGKQSDKFTLLSLTLNGVIKRDMENPTGKFPSSFDTYKKIRKGDFIFCMFDNEETPRAFGLSHLDGMITGAYDVMHLDSKLYLESYLNYYFLNIDNQKGLKPLYKGLRKTVPLDAFLSLKIMLPPLSEQSAIVAYLDRVTSQLDEAIAQQQRMIDLLNERKQIIIQHAVTKGLDPNAEMVDSGVEWIGRMPKGWKIEPFGQHFSFGGGLPITKANLQDSGIAVISYGQIHSKENIGTTISNSLIRFVSSKYLNTNKQCLLNKNDFIFADTSEDIEGAGNFAFNDYDESIFAGYHTIIARPNNLLCPKYYAYLFKSKGWKSQVQSLVNGVKVYSIGKRILKSSQILIPTKEEQKEIVDSLDRSTSAIESHIGIITKQITLLRERKQIIINEVVTGKVKVS